MSETLEIRERNIEQVTAEIVTIQRQTERIVLSAAIEIGRRLVEVKAMVPYGQWGEYIEQRLNYSQSTVNNFMRVYEEYGDRQESLFGADYQAIENLSYTKVLRLLALPAEERAEFVEANDVENMSTRELEKALKDREAENQALQERAEQAEATVEDLQADVETAKANEQKWRSDALAAEQAAQTARQESAKRAEEVQKLKESLERAEKAEAVILKQLKQAKENPEVSEDVMAQLRRQAEQEAAEKAAETVRKELEKATKAAQEAEKKAREAKERAEAAEHKARLANPDMTMVSGYLQGTQEQFKKLLEVLRRVKAADPETGATLKQNIRDKLLSTMEKMLEGV